MLSRASFRQLLLLALLGMAGLLGAVSWNGLQALERLLAQGRQGADEALALNQAAQGLAERSTDLERAARQFMVLDDEALRQRYEQQAQNMTALLAPLQAVDGTRQAAADWQAALAAITAQLDDTSPGRAAREPAVADAFRTLARRSLSLTAQVQHTIARHNAALQQAVAARQVALAQQLGAVMALAAAAALAMGWWLSRPLRRLGQAIVALGENRLDEPLAVSGPADLRSLGRQLDGLRQRLAALQADQARFLRQVSHELKTPLAAMREGVALLREGVGGPLSTGQHEIADILAHNCVQLQRQIEDLLRFHAAAFEARQLQRQPTDLRALLQQVVDAHRLPAQARRVQVSVDGPPLVLRVDGPKLAVALGNLLSNAIRFSPVGGAVQWTLGTSAGQAELRISDAGPGVPLAERARIFEPFFSGAQPPDDQPRGSGVGLSIVRETVAGHGGQVRLLPQPAQQPGACFCITLPMEGTLG